jgi:RecA/RadA recombinase
VTGNETPPVEPPKAEENPFDVFDLTKEEKEILKSSKGNTGFHCARCREYFPLLPRFIGQVADLDKKFCKPCWNLERGLPQDFKVDYYEDLINMPAEKIDWIVDGWIPSKGVVVIGGKRSSYKTWIALNAAMSIATGKPFLGQYATTKSNVLYINQENPTPVIATRLKQFKDLAVEKEGLGFINFSGFNFNDRRWPQWLDEFIALNCISVVIADPFAGCHDIKEDDAGEMRNLLTNVLGQIANKRGCTFILIHHLRKSIAGGNRSPSDPMDELRGSSELANYPDVVIIVDRPHNAKDKFILKQVKCRHAAEHTADKFSVVFEEDGAPSFVFEGSVEDIVTETEKCMSAIIAWAEDRKESSFTTKEAGDAVEEDGYHKKMVNRALKLGVEKSWLKKVERGTYAITTGAQVKAQTKLEAVLKKEGAPELKKEGIVPEAPRPLAKQVLEWLQANGADVVPQPVEKIVAGVGAPEPDVITALENLERVGSGIRGPSGLWAVRKEK